VALWQRRELLLHCLDYCLNKEAPLPLRGQRFDESVDSIDMSGRLGIRCNHQPEVLLDLRLISGLSARKLGASIA
jgi:hypothetical protein